MKLVFATSNRNKAKEISALLPSNFTILTLTDINVQDEVPETSQTIEGNAVQKANYITGNFGVNCFADDTGLEIELLNGDPGVKSARYAGEHRSDTDNISLVLSKLSNQKNRTARFKTIIALNIDGAQYIFEGIVNGIIRKEESGNNGFGYDPIFEPENCGKTFAEMTLEEKNSYSHRARAFKKMIDFLSNYSTIN